MFRIVFNDCTIKNYKGNVGDGTSKVLNNKRRKTMRPSKEKLEEENKETIK
jgi:hypothetical protein